MLVATTVMLLGLLGGIIAAQLQSLRLGGVIIVPLFAVYILRSFGTFPVLVMSVLGGYVSLWIVKRRLLLYGRSLFIIAIASSGVVPLIVYLLITLGFGPEGVVSELGFIGSVLPGIAVYNFHRQESEQRVIDALWSMTLLFFLIVVGIGLVIFVGLTPLRRATPPVLLGPKSDIARAFGLVVEGFAHPVILPFPKEIGMLGLGMVLSEGVRARWGIRVGGIIVLPLLVLFAFRNVVLPPLYLGTVIVSYIGIQLLHYWTLIYGRVLLSMSVVLSLLVVISVAPTLSFENGLLPFFIGVVGGVSAYNFHVVSPAERRASAVIACGGFVILAGVARLFLTPFSSGILVDVTYAHLVVGLAAVGVALWQGYQIEQLVPERSAELPTVFESTEQQPIEELQ